MRWPKSLPRPVLATDSTVPAILDAACERSSNATALNQPDQTGWHSLSNTAFRHQCQTVAWGLLSLGLQPGDTVALLMQNDVNFAVADMASLMAGLIDVPIDLTQTIEQIVFMLQHSEAKLLFVAKFNWLEQLLPYLNQLPALQHLVLESVDEMDRKSIQFNSILSLTDLQGRGQVYKMLSGQPQLPTVAAHDLATIIYIPSATGELLGVMLTHRNLAGNAMAAFASLSGLQWDTAETVLSFLPLTHVFARTLLYGHLYYGHSIYFSTPAQVLKHLKQIQPTILATVPIFLEKIFDKFLDWGQQVESRWKQRVFAWTLKLMQHQEKRGHHAILLRLADRLVLSQWRSLFGGRIKYVLSGGAALKAELVNGFAAAGVTVLQGYGLTQAGIVCFNRAENNQAGTVGASIPGLEVSLAPDAEILVRGDFVTPGYYKNPAATLRLIDAQGWLHTGDLGHFTVDGLLQITGIKKPLFKLATGKYIAPQPLEARLMQSPLVARAWVVGANRKHCAALILPDWIALRQHLQSFNLDDETLLQHACTLALYQAVVEAANCHLPYWAAIKRFRLISPHTQSGTAWLTGGLNRQDLPEVFATEIDWLYRKESLKPNQIEVTDQEMAEALQSETCPVPPEFTCPVYAQSLNVAR